MTKYNQKKGFTLLELIIVVIIIGVLASLALPRFFNTVELSRAAEAYTNLGALRESFMRCAIRQNVNPVTTVQCHLTGATQPGLDIDNPNALNNRLFDYTMFANITGAPATPTFTVQAASRRDLANDWIRLDQAGVRTCGGTYTSGGGNCR